MVLRGRGGGVIGRAAGSGVLDPGALAAKARMSEEIEQGKSSRQASTTPMRNRERHDRALVPMDTVTWLRVSGLWYPADTNPDATAITG